MVKEVVGVEKKGMRVGKYELGRTLGEGNFGKVKFAKNIETGQGFAVKILEKKRILDLKIGDQVRKETKKKSIFSYNFEIFIDGFSTILFSYLGLSFENFTSLSLSANSANLWVFVGCGRQRVTLSKLYKYTYFFVNQYERV